MFCNLREGERKLEEAQRLTHVGYWERDLDTDLISWSDETNRIFGFQPQERTLNLAGLAGLIHPEDQQIMVQAVAKHFRVGSNNSIVLDHKLNPVRGGPPAKVGAAEETLAGWGGADSSTISQRSGAISLSRVSFAAKPICLATIFPLRLMTKVLGIPVPPKYSTMLKAPMATW
jgi:hypothetical protein